MTPPESNRERLTRIAADTVGAAQRQLPPEIRALARGVAVHYDRAPSDDLIASGFEPDILGLFVGNPHGSEHAGDSPLPPQILLYLDNLWDFAEGADDAFRAEVRVTYLHELGHYLGWDEDDLAARGLD
jgi:predicted Zn-dependent protease with MMP-like domain